MITIIIITLIFSSIYYNFASKMLLSQSEQAILRSLKQLEYNTDQLFDNVNNISRQMLVSAYFSQELNTDSLSSAEDVRTVNEIYAYFSTLMISYNYIDSLFYYGDNGIIIGSSISDHYFKSDTQKSNFFYASDLFQKTDGSNNVAISGIYSSADFFNTNTARKKNEHYITLSRSIKTLGHTTGVIVVNMKESYLRSLYHNDNINSDGKSYLLDQNDIIISAGDKSIISSQAVINRSSTDYTAEFLVDGLDNLENNKNNQIIFYPFNQYKLSIIYEIPYSVLFHDIQYLKQIIEIICILGIAASFIISVFWIYKITKPLENLLHAMHTMSEGNIGLKLDENIKSELGILGKQFNRMSTNIMELVEENKAIQEERHKLELQNLQNQINPHFLYNTLNTIKWMAIVSKADNVSNSITALGNMLKPIYSGNEANWTLEDEITYLKNYICIMNYRTGNSIDFLINIQENQLQYVLPKFILQPIVENSIIHSNPLNDIKNIITMNARLQNEYMIIELTDIGVGIAPDRLAYIKNLLQSGDHNSLHNSSANQTADKEDAIGIGLLNVHKRIKLQYGSECGLDILSIVGKGTAITIKIKI
jgi:sensor histidine kinase YesM